MIKRSFEYYCDEIENVENYELAKADNFKGWDCHHRLETHNSDGERRSVDITRKELKALGMYYHRPANELTLLPRKEHIALHMKRRCLSEETKRKMFESQKGKKAWIKIVYMRLRKRCVAEGLDYKVAGNMQQFAETADEMAVADYYSKIYMAERELEAIVGD